MFGVVLGVVLGVVDGAFKRVEHSFSEGVSFLFWVGLLVEFCVFEAALFAPGFETSFGIGVEVVFRFFIVAAVAEFGCHNRKLTHNTEEPQELF